jgi:DNA-binding NarL/FixJ family response regulator
MTGSRVAGSTAERRKRISRSPAPGRGDLHAEPERRAHPTLSRVLAGRTLTVLVADDYDIVRWGFQQVLSRAAWVRRCLVADDAEHAIVIARRERPHAALVDFSLGESSGLEVCQRLREVSPRTRVLLIGARGRISPRAAGVVGAAGVLGKDRPVAEITDALLRVGLGLATCEPTPSRGLASLTERERVLLELMSDGATNREIAVRLRLSPNTVKDQVSSAYRKLDVRNRAQAVRRAHRLGLVS